MAVNLIAQTAYFHYLYCIQKTISQTNKPMNMEENTFMSENIDQITTALSAFQGEVEQPSLNKTNPYFKSRYVDLSGVLKSVQPSLAKNGLCVTQIINGDNLVTLLSHKSGQWFKSICPIGSYKSQQDRGSAITYTKRYAICAMLGIAADTDDDGNSATDTDNKGKSGIALQQPVNSPVQSNTEIERQAIADIQTSRNLDEFNTKYLEWSNSYAFLKVKTSAFYQAASEIHSQLKSAQ